MRGPRLSYFFWLGHQSGETMKRVAIVGGGVAGLAAAYELARLARDGVEVQVVLFEASTRLGGIVEAGIEAGEIRAEVEPRRVANMMIAALEGALTISRLEGDKEALRDAAWMLERMLEGIKVTREKRPARAAVTP